MAEQTYDQMLEAWQLGDLKHRPQKRPDGISTRCDLQFHTMAERAITEAMQAVEQAGASPALTDAVNLLSKARDRVADHVEGVD